MVEETVDVPNTLELTTKIRSALESSAAHLESHECVAFEVYIEYTRMHLADVSVHRCVCVGEIQMANCIATATAMEQNAKIIIVAHEVCNNDNGKIEILSADERQADGFCERELLECKWEMRRWTK